MSYRRCYEEQGRLCPGAPGDRTATGALDSADIWVGLSLRIKRTGPRLRAVHGDQRQDSMPENCGPTPPSHLPKAYLSVRALTERLAAPLSAEDQTVQSM